MTDRDSSLNYTYLGGHTCVRKSYRNQRNEENMVLPKIIIKKRPPRRPKLKDGTEAYTTFNSNIFENTETTLQTTNNNGNIVENNIRSIPELDQTDEIIKEIKDKIQLLQINRENHVLEAPKNELSIKEKSSNKTRSGKVKKRKKEQKYECFNHENTKVENNEVLEASTSTDTSEKNIGSKNDTYESIQYINKTYWNKVGQIDQNNQNIESNGKLQESSKENENFLNKSKVVKKKRKQKKKVFCQHLSIDVIKKILAAQDPISPNVIEGYLYINPRYCQNAYIRLSPNDEDILIVGLKDRNRALEGDLVAVIINPPNKWFYLNKNNTYQKTGCVISILEKAHPRKAVGFLKKQDVFVFLQPRDSRVPLMKINPKTVPKNFYDNPNLFEETLFLGKIVDWKKVAFAEGEIEQLVGNKGDLYVESRAILLDNNLILDPFQEELLKDLPHNYFPTEADIADRVDLRKTCIFTIDPETAVDLDDALHCKILENGNVEVGVHIADVTHFLPAFSPLDEKVAERATTVYMVDKVHHMLPKELCLACSLLPGQDRLAFSVILEMTSSSDIVNYYFSKSVINSCCQMSYDQAQIMIDNESYDWDNNDTLKVTGNYKPSDLVKEVNNLYKLSIQLRKKRYNQGALKIVQPKLCIFLDKDTRIPVSYNIEKLKESNSLIEEFMLLANITVAKHLYENLPEVSLLRLHANPSQRMLSEARNLLNKFGVLINIESAGSLHDSLINYQLHYDLAGESKDNRSLEYKMLVINNLCAKSMKRAQYTCSSSVKAKEDLKHYALNVEFYTHFTSPIRRYPDCIVHRLLYASIKNEAIPTEWSTSLCQKVALNCNIKKYSAKMAQEQSKTLYFIYMLDLRGSMNVDAVVLNVKQSSADAILCDTGLKIRIYFKDTIEETISEFTTENEIPTVTLTWMKQKLVQVINVFSILHVKITKHPQLFRLQGIILPPA